MRNKICNINTFSIFQQELFESLDDKLDEDLIEALAALSLPKAMYDARTLHLSMKVSCFI